jgi:hypothetical protein
VAAELGWWLGEGLKDAIWGVEGRIVNNPKLCTAEI